MKESMNERGLPVRATDNPLYRHPSMKLLRRAIIREKRLQLVASVLLLVLGVVTVYWGWNRSELVGWIGVVATLVGIWLTYKTVSQQNVAENKLIQILFYQPEQIVWVYGLVTQHQPFGFNTTRSGVLYFYLVDGDDISVSLPAKKLKQVSFFLNRMLPRAVFGYTEERARQYANDPQSVT